MKNNAIKAAAIALVLSPNGVNAELLSQHRVKEILSTQGGDPVSVETMQSRDKDLLITLGTTLREKYGEILTGSEIVFTRTERAGRVVYRMDFINVKSQEHALGICQILEMEDCVILMRNGSANLVSAEFDEDGLLSLDDYVPFSGAVRMEALPTKAAEVVTAQQSEPRQIVEETMRLPLSRPDIAKTFAAEVDVPDGTVQSGARKVALDVPEVSVLAGKRIVRLEALGVDVKTGPRQVTVAAPQFDVALGPRRVTMSNPEVSIEIGSRLVPLARPEASVVTGPRLVSVSAPQIDMSAGERVVALVDVDITVESGPRVIELTEPEIDYTTGSRRVALDRVDASITTGPRQVSVTAPYVGVSTGARRVDLTKPSVDLSYALGLAVEEAVLPLNRPFEAAYVMKDVMDLPHDRPTDTFGIFNYLPINRSDAITVADREVFNSKVTLIATSLDTASIIISPHKLASDMSGFSTSVPVNLTIDLPGIGITVIPENLPSLDIEMSQKAVTASMSSQDGELELELAGMNDADVSELPSVFVLSFEEEGVKAFKDPIVSNTISAIEIASVVMTDAFSKPFDITGTGEPMLQKLPKSRPDFSMYDADIQLVSGNSEGVLLAALMAKPIQVAQAEGGSPGDVLMQRLSGLTQRTDISVSNVGTDLVADPEPAKIIIPTPAVEVTVAAPKPVAPAFKPLVIEDDGLVNIDDDPGADTKARALAVLDQIEKMQSPQPPAQTMAPAAPDQRMTSADERGIFDIATPKQPDISANSALRIELSYAYSREEVSARADELKEYIPKVMMTKGRFYGYRVPGTASTFIIGIEAADIKARDDIIWYLEKMQIPWALSGR